MASWRARVAGKLMKTDISIDADWPWLFNKRNFRRWLLMRLKRFGPNEIYLSKERQDCPLAVFSGFEVSSKFFSFGDEVRVLALPRWAREFTRRVDSGRGKGGVILAREALEILDSI